MALAVSGLSPVIMTVRMPIARSSREALEEPVLDDVLQVDDAEDARRAVGVLLRDDERRAAARRDRVDALVELGVLARRDRPLVLDPGDDRRAGALADDRPVGRGRAPTCGSAP